MDITPQLQKRGNRLCLSVISSTLKRTLEERIVALEGKHCTRLDQAADQSNMSVFSRHLQCSDSNMVFIQIKIGFTTNIHIDASLHKNIDDCLILEAHRSHQRRALIAIDSIWISAMIQEKIDSLYIFSSDRCNERTS